MSTRIYLPSSGTPDVTPSTWNFPNQINPLSLKAVTTKINSAQTTKLEATGTTSPTFRAMFRWVIGPLKTQNVAGTVNLVMQAMESNAGANATLAVAVKIIKPDGTDRAALLAYTASDLINNATYEIPTTALGNRRAWNASETRPVPLTAQDATAGDYLVIEVGFRSETTTSRNISIRYGDTTTADLADADSGANDYAPWIDFSQTLLLPLSFTSKATGNWTAEGATTWNEAGHPDYGDTVAIANGHIVTVDATHNIGITTCNGGLTLATGVTATASGALTLGSAADSTFTFGAGSTLALGANNLALGRVSIVSNATSASWAYVTGTGQIVTSGTPKQSLGTAAAPLKYVSWQITGNILFGLDGTTGALTNQMYFQNCAFVGGGANTFKIGMLNTTPLATNISITETDFREIGEITLTSDTGTKIATRDFKHNSMNNSTTYTGITLQGSTGWDFDGTVFGNYHFSTSHTIGGHTLKNTLQYMTLGATATGYLVASSVRAAWTSKDNYVYNNMANSRYFLTDTDGGGSGTQLIAGNIFELMQTDGDWIALNSALAMNILRNIVLDAGSDGFCFSVSANANTPTINIARNTIFAKESFASGGGLLYFKTATNAAAINEVNNLLSAAATKTIGYGNWVDTIHQDIHYAGYNDYDGVTTNWAEINAGNWENHDGTDLTTTGELNDVAPQFKDSARNIAKWNSTVNGGTETAAAALAYLLAINGYNATTKTQSDTPSVRYPSDLVTWVKEGFQVQNVALDEAGDASYAVSDDGNYTLGSGSRTIGAMDYAAGAAQEVLSDLATSASSVTALQTFVNIVSDSISSLDSVTDIQSYIQTLIDNLSGMSVVSDIQSYLATLNSVIQSSSSLTAIQTYVESLQSLAVSSSSVTEFKAFVETVQSIIVSASTLTDLQSMIEALLSTASSASSVTDLQSYLAALQSVGVSASTIQDFKTYIEILQSTIVSSASISDAVVRLEILQSVAQSASSLTDIQSYVQSLTSTGNSISSAAALQSYVNSLQSIAISTGSIADIQIYLETLQTVGISGASVTDQKTFFDEVQSVVQSLSSVVDIKTMIENLLTLAQGHASLSDLQSYIQTLLTTIQSQSSIVEFLSSEHIENLLTTIVSQAGVYDYYKKAGMEEAAILFYMQRRNTDFVFQERQDFALKRRDTDFRM